MIYKGASALLLVTVVAASTRRLPVALSAVGQHAVRCIGMAPVAVDRQRAYRSPGGRGRCGQLPVADVHDGVRDRLSPPERELAYRAGRPARDDRPVGPRRRPGLIPQAWPPTSSTIPSSTGSRSPARRSGQPTAHSRARSRTARTISLCSSSSSRCRCESTMCSTVSTRSCSASMRLRTSYPLRRQWGAVIRLGISASCAGT